MRQLGEAEKKCLGRQGSPLGPTQMPSEKVAPQDDQTHCSSGVENFWRSSTEAGFWRGASVRAVVGRGNIDAALAAASAHAFLLDTGSGVLV